MAVTEVSIRGTLRADGTLELAGRPDLPEGPVEVVIKAVAAPLAPGADRTGGLLEFLDRARAELAASGHRFRTKEEIDADIAEERDWGEDRAEAAYRANEAWRADQAKRADGAVD